MSEKTKKLKVNDIDFAATASSGNISLSGLSEWYLVFKAIEGEKLAADLLNAAGFVAYDIDGNQIFPVP